MYVGCGFLHLTFVWDVGSYALSRLLYLVPTQEEVSAFLQARCVPVTYLTQGHVFLPGGSRETHSRFARPSFPLAVMTGTFLRSCWVIRNLHCEQEINLSCSKPLWSWRLLFPWCNPTDSESQKDDPFSQARTSSSTCKAVPKLFGLKFNNFWGSSPVNFCLCGTYLPIICRITN